MPPRHAINARARFETVERQAGQWAFHLSEHNSSNFCSLIPCQSIEGHHIREAHRKCVTPLTFSPDLPVSDFDHGVDILREFKVLKGSWRHRIQVDILTFLFHYYFPSWNNILI